MNGTIWKQFWKHRLGTAALFVVGAFCIVGIYAPFLASSKPLVVVYDGTWYFPLFRYLFFPGFYTKRLDIFFNLLIFTFPFMLMRKKIALIALITQCMLFIALISFPPKDPIVSAKLNQARQQAPPHLPSWNFDLQFMTPYAKLSEVLKYMQQKAHHNTLMQHYDLYAASAKEAWLDNALRIKQGEMRRQGLRFPSDEELKQEILSTTPEEVVAHYTAIPSLWQIQEHHKIKKIERQKRIMQESPKDSDAYRKAKATLNKIMERDAWLKAQSQKISFEMMPLLRPFHWEDDAGGEQSLNQYIPWWELTRTNRKDLVAGLIFGIRISLVVGILAVFLAMAIGIPVGSLAGYYGGTFDIVVSRLLEIWESMPTFFMLLLVIAVTQSKSIFLVITVIGIFGWTAFSRYIRGEFFKQRNLPYVEACHALGFQDSRIMFSHILPNAIPPILTLLPFAVMGAITSEAGLSFLGLGEEGSCSWGVLMDEGRTAFPGESYLLWPPAILLTILLIAIALVGDAIRDTLDPKMHK